MWLGSKLVHCTPLSIWDATHSCIVLLVTSVSSICSTRQFFIWKSKGIFSPCVPPPPQPNANLFSMTASGSWHAVMKAKFGFWAFWCNVSQKHNPWRVIVDGLVLWRQMSLLVNIYNWTLQRVQRKSMHTWFFFVRNVI